jgi:hypothetical protein
LGETIAQKTRKKNDAERPANTDTGLPFSVVVIYLTTGY